MCHPPENSRGKPLWCLLVTCLGKRRRGTWGESPGSESYSEVGGWVPQLPVAPEKILGGRTVG